MLFRVWKKVKNKYDANNISLEQDGRLSINGVIINEKDYCIEYSTGLKDTDEKEIFQGDIIEGHLHSNWSHNIIRCEVVWNETRACFECREYAPNGNDSYWAHKVRFSKDVKIIGNIHENKNLLARDKEGNYVIQSLG